MNKILLIGESEIKKQSIIEHNADSKVLSNVIWNVQEIQLKAVLGKELYDLVLSEADKKADAPSYIIPALTQELLDDYITPYLTYATLADFLIVNNYKVTNKGVLKLNDNAGTSINNDELNSVKNHYDNYLAAYKNRLIEFLKANKLIEYGTDKDVNSYSIGWALSMNGYGVNPTPSTNKATHTHTINEIIGLQEALDNAGQDYFTGYGISIDNHVISVGSHTHLWADITDKPTFSSIATSGSYNDLLNLPTLFTKAETDALYKAIGYIPDWSEITSKPNFAVAATSGSYNDLTDKPVIPTYSGLDFIVNGTTQQTANFNILGSGTIGTNLTVDGRLGLGTPNPNWQLTLQSSYTNTGVFGVKNPTNGIGFAGGLWSNGSGFFQIYDGDSTPTVQLSGTSSGLNYINSGNLLIGTTTDSGHKLYVNGISAATSFKIHNSSANYAEIYKGTEANSKVVVFTNSGDSSGFGGGFVFKAGHNGTASTSVNIMRIYSNSSTIPGAVYIGNVTDAQAQAGVTSTTLGVLNRNVGTSNSYDAGLNLNPNSVNVSNYNYVNGKQFGIGIISPQGADNFGDFNTPTSFGVFIGFQSQPLSNGYASSMLFSAKNESGVGAEIMRLQGKDGNVGINTTNAQYKLDVNGTGRFQTSLEIVGTGGLTLGGGATAITYSGNELKMGTGASWATVSLYLGAANKYNHTSITTTINNTNLNLLITNFQLGGVTVLKYVDTDLQFGSVTSGFTNLTFYTAAAVVGKIFSNGNWFVGTTPADNGYKLDVNGTVRVSSTLTANNDIEITDAAKGIILKSPNGKRYRVTVADNGSLTSTAI